MRHSQFNILNLKTNNETRTADLIVYGDIGEDEWFDEVTSKKVITDLNDLDVDDINVYINSNGGTVTTALAINNVLKRHKAKKTAYIDGIAASSATILTSACDIVKMPKNALFMVHNPWTISIGDKNNLNKTIDTLDKAKEAILESYIAKTGQDKEILSKLMDDETWLNAEEALKYGFIDEIVNEEIEKEQIENKLIMNGLVFNMSRFNNFNFNNKKIENKNIKNKEENMTREEIKNKFPEIYEEIVNEGRVVERNRIKELEEIGIESELINKAKFESFKNLSEISVDLLKEQQALNKAKVGETPKAKPQEENKTVVKDDYRDGKKPIVNVANPEQETKATLLGADINAIINKMNNEEVK